MKRIALLGIVLTIALASVCWAEELTGMWKLDSQELIELVPNSEKAESLKDLVEDEPSYDEYITVNPDGVMTIFSDFDVAYNLAIGRWYKCAPDTYLFIYDFAGSETISFMTVSGNTLKYRTTYKDEAYIEFTYTKIEEE